MKDQYVGDINDYIKYSVIRALAAAAPDLSVVVAWMRTPDDGTSDGGSRGYLRQAHLHRHLDASAFDALSSTFADNAPSLHLIEAAGLITKATFLPELLLDDMTARRDYFRAVSASVGERSLFFYDPDNGLSVASVRKGRRGSAKYLYWDELAECLGLGHSALVYQHFPRVARAPYLATLLARMADVSPQHEVFALYGSRAAFLVAAQGCDAECFRRAATELSRRSRGLVQMTG